MAPARVEESPLRVYALTAVVLAIVISGCGSPPHPDDKPATNGEETKPAADVLSDAHSAFLGAASVHVRGRVTRSGVVYTVDDRLVPSGGSVVEKSKYGEARFLTKDAVFYLKVPTSAYSTGGRSIPPGLQNQWLQRSADDHSARVSLGDFFRDLNLDEEHLRPQVTVVPGVRPTVTITSSEGSRLTVAGTGPPVPLSFTAKDGEAYTFDSYNAPVSIEVPTNATKISCGQFSCDF